MNTMIAEMIDKGHQDLANKRSFLLHQERDLVACVSSERAGRELEIEQLKQEIKVLEEVVAKLEKGQAEEEALEEAAADVADNLRGLAATIRSEFERCPHGYTPEYVEAYAKVVEVLTTENIMKLLGREEEEE
jgi:hypothetical protein